MDNFSGSGKFGLKSPAWAPELGGIKYVRPGAASRDLPTEFAGIRCDVHQGISHGGVCLIEDIGLKAGEELRTMDDELNH